MAHHVSKIFVIGGTGAQGIPVIRGLVKDRKYSVRALTRDTNSPRAKQLLALGNVELVSGTFASEHDLRAGFRGCDGAFINIDGFNSGEKTEIFWAIRAYEIAREEGIKFFVYGNLDFVYKKSGYDPSFRCGHYDGKGRVGEWILAQNNGNEEMGAACFTTGPYIDMTISAHTVMTPTIEDGVVTWRMPLGKDGAVVHVALDDCEYYVRWLFDNPERANGMDLEVGIDHIGYEELASAFSKVSGHPARFIDTSYEEYWTKGPMASAAQSAGGYNADVKDPASMTWRQNFTGFFNVWRASGGNKGVVQRDYKLLDEIHPGRIKSAEEWFRKEEEKGKREGTGSLWEKVNDLKPVLKLAEDRRKGKL